MTDRDTEESAIAGDEPVLVAKGLGGNLALQGNILRIHKGGPIGALLMLLGIEGGFVQRSIRVSDISAVEIESPLFLLRYVRFSYPGSPEQSGYSFTDMLAENALVMSLFDSRNVYRLKERIEQSMLERPTS